MNRRRSVSWLLLPVLAGLSGCSSSWQMMPTPNLYAQSKTDPFADVPPVLAVNQADVLYLTDRRPENQDTSDPRYGYKRSRSVAFGVSHVQFGEDVSWEKLVEASRSKKRSDRLSVKVTATQEMGRFPQTPRVLVELPATNPAATSPSMLHSEVEAAKSAAAALLAERLALSPVKDVFVFVHGYANSFDDSIITIAQLWHFLGRRGVPVAYSWPAGHGGLLRGYTYDRESSEFTVYHLKEMLRFIASCPGVERIHLIAHSRGTDVATTALRELHLEFSGGGKSTRKELKLATLLLAAPDLDLDVVIQRLITAHIGRVPERFALYVCAQDEALGISNWLFSGGGRLGKLKSSIFTAEELQALRDSKTVQVIDARVSDPGPNAHSYFYENPAVSSDVILLLRYEAPPGAASGRPLRAEPDGFWVIDDDYPEIAPRKVAKR